MDINILKIASDTKNNKHIKTVLIQQNSKVKFVEMKLKFF